MFLYLIYDKYMFKILFDNNIFLKQYFLFKNKVYTLMYLLHIIIRYGWLSIMKFNVFI